MVEFIMEFDDAIYDEKTGMSVFKPRVVGELIRCKDCTHYREEPSGQGLCEGVWYDGDGGDQYVEPTDYCSEAERRTDE